MIFISTLYQNQTLTMGDKIISNNSVYYAILQTDGNLAVYNVCIQC